ncbi:MAG: hypothetical protein ABJH06_10615 [Paraglaciecola sp.]|uniref:hypothetical protein n=1 Tax=Paraglaciecola sp. TaxID=1920173 RepID=UPI003299D00A
MNNWVIVLLAVLILIGSIFIFKLLSNKPSPDDLVQGKDYIFTFLCVFSDENMAITFLTAMEGDGLKGNVSLSPNKEKYWVKFQLTTKPKLNKHLIIESKLMANVVEAGGVYACTDVFDPDADGTLFE